MSVTPPQPHPITGDIVYPLIEVGFTDWLWLPPNITWDMLEDNPNYASIDHFWAVIPGTIILLLLRLFLEKVVFVRLGYALGIKKQNAKYKENTILEKEFKSFGRKKAAGVSKARYEELSQETGISVIEIKRWFRRRTNATITPVVDKFAESLFRFLFYSISFAYGMSTLIGKDYLFDVTRCWDNMPFSEVDEGSKWYYIIQLSYYFGCLITLPFDNKRKDFKELVIHHLATCLLVFLSYMVNFYKIGVLVMAVHDVSDIVLDLAKTFNYAQFTKMADNLFVVFAIVFFVSRIIIFPFVLVNSTLNDTVQRYFQCSAWEYVTSARGPYPWVPVYLCFNGLLITLLILHIFWFSIIVKMAIDMIGKGHVEGDVRSDQAESSEDEDGDTVDQKLKEKLEERKVRAKGNLRSRKVSH